MVDISSALGDTGLGGSRSVGGLTASIPPASLQEVNGKPEGGGGGEEEKKKGLVVGGEGREASD